MTETDLMNLIRMELSQRGFTVFRVNVGKVRALDLLPENIKKWIAKFFPTVFEKINKYSRIFDTGLPKGHSDLVAYKNGEAYFIETKIHPNKPTKEQLNFIEQMIKQGCAAGVAYSVEDAIQICS